MRGVLFLPTFPQLSAPAASPEQSFALRNQTLNLRAGQYTYR